MGLPCVEKNSPAAAAACGLAKAGEMAAHERFPHVAREEEIIPSCTGARLHRSIISAHDWKSTGPNFIFSQLTCSRSRTFQSSFSEMPPLILEN